jgi:hypothetical protein
MLTADVFVARSSRRCRSGLRGGARSVQCKCNNLAGESPVMRGVRTMKLGSERTKKLAVRGLPTNQTMGLEANLQAVGTEHRKSLENTISEAEPLGSWRRQHHWWEIWMKPTGDSDGVMVTACKRWLLRNWRAPPHPSEKDRRAR